MSLCQVGSHRWEEARGDRMAGRGASIDEDDGEGEGVNGGGPSVVGQDGLREGCKRSTHRPGMRGKDMWSVKWCIYANLPSRGYQYNTQGFVYRSSLSTQVCPTRPNPYFQATFVHHHPRHPPS